MYRLQPGPRATRPFAVLRPRLNTRAASPVHHQHPLHARTSLSYGTSAKGSAPLRLVEAKRSHYKGPPPKKMASVRQPANGPSQQQQKRVAIPGLTSLAQQPAQAPPANPQVSGTAQAQKGTKSKHAQRIQASQQAATSKQRSKKNAQRSRSGSIPKNLVENNPQWKNDNSRPRAIPSRASGGVPEPTTQYLAQTLSLSQALPVPRRILVVIDLNGTLLYRPSRRRPFHFVERPYARDFLAYCLDTFYVAIWSSARPDNVHKMVAQLLSPAQVDRCVLVWARDRFGLDAADYDARVQCYKRLTRVWSDPAVQASCPESLGRWDQTNTVLVDDSPEKGRSEPFNILALPEFSGLENEAPQVLPQVHDYLNTLCGQSNVSSYVRQSPFSLDPNYVLPP